LDHFWARPERFTAIDCYVLGSRTYEHALQLGWHYGDTPTVVMTNRELPSTRESVEFYSGGLKRLVGRPERVRKALALEETSCRETTGSSGYRITAVGRCW